MKYAVAPALHEIHIVVSAREASGDLVLKITDDGGRPARPTRRGGGVGLKNVQARLSAAYGDRGRLRTQHLASGFHAELRFPLTCQAYDAWEPVG